MDVCCNAVTASLQQVVSSTARQHEGMKNEWNDACTVYTLIKVVSLGVTRRYTALL